MTEMTLAAPDGKIQIGLHDKGLYAKVGKPSRTLSILLILLKVSVIQSGGFSPNEKNNLGRNG
jgi:hypothetical protein